LAGTPDQGSPHKLVLAGALRVRRRLGFEGLNLDAAAASDHVLAHADAFLGMARTASSTAMIVAHSVWRAGACLDSAHRVPAPGPPRHPFPGRCRHPF